jgi:hypothetical protein
LPSAAATLGILGTDGPWTRAGAHPLRDLVDNNRQLTAEQIIASITSDSALHDVIQRLLEEMQGFRADINQLHR